MLPRDPPSLPPPHGDRGEPRGSLAWATWTLLCLAVWSVYFAAFFPGFISPDFAAQWEEIAHHRLADWHPAIHTLFIWLVTRLWLSPAAVVAADILLLVGAAAFVLRLLERQRAPRSVLAMVALFFALHPLNGIYAVSLWKDGPYSIALLLLTALCAEVALSRGAWLDQRRHLVALFAAALAVALLRHNGVLPAAATLGALLLVPGRRLKVAAVALGVAAAVVVVRLPLYRALGVDTRSRALLAAVLPMHQVAAILHADRPLSAEEARTLEEILPLPEWSRAYTPYTCMPLAFNPRLNRTFFDDPQRAARFRGVWLALARRNLDVVARHQIRVSSLVWSIRDPDGTYVFPDEGITTADLGLTPSGPPRLLARLGAGILRAFHRAGRSALGPLLYRGAPYLYALLLGAAALAWRRRDAGMLLVAVPAASNAAAFLVLAIVQDTRLVWASFLVAPLALGLLFTPPGRAAAPGPLPPGQAPPGGA